MFKRLILAAMITATVVPTSANAAKPGDLIPINALPMPPGAVPASHSGMGSMNYGLSDLSADG